MRLFSSIYFLVELFGIISNNCGRGTSYASIASDDIPFSSLVHASFTFKACHGLCFNVLYFTVWRIALFSAYRDYWNKKNHLFSGGSVLLACYHLLPRSLLKGRIMFHNHEKRPFQKKFRETSQGRIITKNYAMRPLEINAHFQYADLRSRWASLQCFSENIRQTYLHYHSKLMTRKIFSFSR